MNKYTPIYAVVRTDFFHGEPDRDTIVCAVPSKQEAENEVKRLNDITGGIGHAYRLEHVRWYPKGRGVKYQKKPEPKSKGPYIYLAISHPEGTPYHGHASWPGESHHWHTHDKGNLEHTHTYIDFDYNPKWGTALFGPTVPNPNEELKKLDDSIPW